MMADDMELVREFAARRSDAAFETLVSRHVNLVYSVALRQVRDPHLAQEVAQAVFIILARKAGSLGPKTILSGWLFRTAQYASADALKTQRRRQHREQEAYMQSILNRGGDAPSQPTNEEAWTQIAPLLDAAMLRLGEKDRNAIVLRFFENKNLREVGAVLGASEDSARVRINRALEKLRKFFTKRGVMLSAAVIGTAVSANSVQAAPVGLAATISAAAVKSSAVAASTLSLVKGALKIMAWTKAKTTIVAGTALVLAGIGTFSVMNYFRHAPPSRTVKLTLPTGILNPMISFGNSGYGIVLASDGSLWAWGEERLGWPALGLKNTNNTVSLRRIGDESDWASVAVGGDFNLAIKSDGSLWAWGQNIYYQLGDGTKTTRATPVRSIPGNDWKQVAGGAANSFGLKNDGTLWAWGNNWAGQLGIGSTTATTNAVQVVDLTNWARIWAGGIQTVGLQSDGSLWYWGLSPKGFDDTNYWVVPTRISPDTNWADVCFGNFSVLAIKSDGILWTWGMGENFYSGSADTNLNMTPMRVWEPTLIGRRAPPRLEGFTPC
jgi:RNA polymerase sigma factor (sigma-70 family)